MLSSDKMMFLHQNVAATQVAHVEVIKFGYRMWTEGQISVDANCCHCFKGNTAELNNEEDSCLWQTRLRTDPRKCKGDGNVKWKSKKPNKRIRNSKTAEQNDGVGREGFLHMPANTKTLPAMHIGISRALRTLFMITEVSKGEDSSSLSNPSSIISTVEFAILKFSILSNVSLQRETAYYFLYSFTWHLIKILTTLPAFNSLTYV